MRTKIIFDLLKLLAVFGILWGIFVIFPIFPDKDDFSLSITKEEKLGKLIVEEVMLKDASFQLIKTDYTDSVIGAIENRLVDAMGSSDYDYKLMIVADDEVNAFALPGGYIMIYSGLIEISDNPEELTAVIAHEMGHIEKRHIVSRLVKELGLSVILSGDLLVVGEVGRTAASTVFDRRQEREADEFSLDLLYKAQIDPRVMATFFRKLKDEVGSYDEKLEILMTHPHINSRIKSSLEYDVDEDFVSKDMQLDWDRFKQNIQEQIAKED
ncbi:MAG: M48 family metallopeptidase [Bacteroidetes bacterium]|jgi:predicted Zn-dependent protease|nr:M48 family metallopeptidase [Bacteroidota bacterium]MBT5527831.1 M48 family metallopeptidase [Cytophagia bacterium]MBT3421325.1 M48 family metallopeptidase [Bacteroidota bacterium]MBT3933281.1 M48 family metallopeptidase [Bacteroidota bacterium]MBT4338768.1 M48 family metallopeptidase [Bacteroidota bacterium]